MKIINIFLITLLSIPNIHPAARPTQQEEENNADLTITDELIIAIDNKENTKAKDLIKSGKINFDLIPKYYGQTVLEIALRKAPDDIVKLLLECGANVNSAKYLSITCLVLPSVEKTKLLLEYGANVNDCAFNFTGTLLINAAYFGNANIVKLLLEYGANVNDVKPSGTSALILASFMGNIDTVRLLLEYGADINLRTSENKTSLDKNKTALDYAKERNFIETYTLLKNWPIMCNFTAEIFEKNKHYDANDYKLYPTLLTGKHTIKNIFLILKNKNNGNSLLHEAVLKRDYKLIGYILNFNPKILADLLNNTNNQNMTPIDLAVNDEFLLNYFMDFAYPKEEKSYCIVQ